MSRQTFRANAAVLLGDGQGNILAFRRAAHVSGTQPWQVPQGGIEVGESPLEGALRELFEETAITAEQVQVIAEHPNWLAYEIPEHYRGRDRGQVQKWFLLRIAPGFQPDLDTAADREFDAAVWMRPKALARQVIDFKRDTYRTAIRHFRKNSTI